jgi:hypothetical protein
MEFLMRRMKKARAFRYATCETLEPRLLLSAGDPDLLFSDDGRTTLNFPGGTFHINAVAVQADGKVVAVGTKTSRAAVVRLNIDGNLDTAFGGGGLF